MGDNNVLAQREAGDAVESADRAFAVVSKFDQEKIDRICAAMAAAALADAERLGRLAHEETGFGRAEDKKEKNRFAAEDVWDYFRDLKTVGVVADDGSIVEIASPRGVVAAIIPSTNPTSTAIFKIIIAIKSRNTIVLSPHPSAARCIAETTRVMREAGIAQGLPLESIQCLTHPTIEGTETLMKHKKHGCHTCDGRDWAR
jgi:acetaldehyde dehydrogenase (acetylating)